METEIKLKYFVLLVISLSSQLLYPKIKLSNSDQIPNADQEFDGPLRAIFYNYLLKFGSLMY